MKAKYLLVYFLIFGLIILLLVLGIAVLGFYNARNCNSWIPAVLQKYKKILFTEEEEITVRGYLFSVITNRAGKVKIIDGNEKIIISSLMYYYSTPDQMDERYGLENVVPVRVNDSTILIQGSGLNGSDVSIWLTACQCSSRLDLKIKTTYNDETKVEREALVVQFDLPVKEVFRKNRTLDENIFFHEYWLDQQGVRFSDGESQALIYHTPGISSLQFDHKRNLIFINLEYVNDHPYIYFPYQSDNGGKWSDQSISVFPNGYERTDSVSVWLGDIPVAVPRLMMLPDGYLSGYVFTEHADGGTIEQHRTVYFGCDTITTATNAIGGFWGNRIPVTKSVFYIDKENPPVCTAIKDYDENNKFLAFLQQLHQTGFYDICLHTPENMDSDRATMEEAAIFMKDHFNTVSWIDHGMLGGKYNRECFHADAFQLGSNFYSADIWKKYGIKYFWNTSYELKEPNVFLVKKELRQMHLRKVSYNFWSNFLTSNELRENNLLKAFIISIKRYNQWNIFKRLRCFIDEALPLPLYWCHPSRTDSFYSWGTHHVAIYSDLWTKQAGKKAREELAWLEEIVRNRIVFIDHGYYVRGIPGIDLTVVEKGNLILNPHFDYILRYMAQRRDDGDLMILTIRDLLDYQLLMKKISFNYDTDVITVTNNNDIAIKGISLAIKQADVLINGTVPKSRISGDDTIFWFDILPHESIRLFVKSH
jgi:hypothetical protein